MSGRLKIGSKRAPTTRGRRGSGSHGWLETKNECARETFREVSPSRRVTTWTRAREFATGTKSAMWIDFATTPCVSDHRCNLVDTRHDSPRGSVSRNEYSRAQSTHGTPLAVAVAPCVASFDISCSRSFYRVVSAVEHRRNQRSPPQRNKIVWMQRSMRV